MDQGNTVYDMRSALIDEKQEKQNSHMSPASNPMPHATPQVPYITCTSEVPHVLRIRILQEKY